MKIIFLAACLIMLSPSVIAQEVRVVCYINSTTGQQVCTSIATPLPVTSQ